MTKIVKEINFERVWGKLKSKKGFHRQSFETKHTKHLRLTLVFCEIAHYRNSWISFFQEFFLLLLTKLLFWQGSWTLGYHSIEFRHFPDISGFPKVLPFDNWWFAISISNNRGSFQLCWKKNWVKHQKVSKFYENDCSSPIEFYTESIII